MRTVRRNTTKSDGLSPPQLRAMAALLAGKTASEAARAARVCRQTLSGWLNHDHAFVARYERAKREYVTAVRVQITAACMEATQLLRRAMKNRKATMGEKVNAARILLDKLPDQDAPNGERPLPGNMCRNEIGGELA